MTAAKDYFGYVGKTLYVDLTTERIWKKPLDLGLARKFIGGPGVGLNILFNNLKPDVHPLSAENVMVFGTGPLEGAGVIGGGKCYLNTKYAVPASRDKNKYFVSTSMFGSNRFGSMMKKAGYDHITITGRAERPCYLKVVNDDIEICHAGDIWGMDVWETGDILRKRHRSKSGKCGTWVIGQAGENLVSFALGFADDFHNAGRFAAPVAGAKNLKAIVISGSNEIKIADTKKHKEIINKKRSDIMSQPNYQKFMPFGSGTLGKVLQDTFVRIEGCAGGMCACKSVHRVQSGIHKGSWFGGVFPSFPAIVHMELGIEGFPENYGAGFKFVETVCKYGLCLITTLHMFKFVAALCQRGVITSEDMGGLEFKAGDLDFYLALLEKLVGREDIGSIMAEGWYLLAEELGIDAASDWEAGCAITKGVDLLVDARVWPSLFRTPGGFSPAMGLSSIVHAKTKHNHSHTYWSSKEVSLDMVKKDIELTGATKEEMSRIFTERTFNTGRLLKYVEDAETVYNSLGICDTFMHWMKDPIRDVPWLSEVYSAVTGYSVTPRELLRGGERVWNLEKMINVREGFNREDDQIPPLYLKNIEIPLKAREGDRYLKDWFGKRITGEDIEGMLDEYYRERGWCVTDGIPTKEKLLELGLDRLVDSLRVQT